MTATATEQVKKWYVVRAISGKEKKVKEVVNNEKTYSDSIEKKENCSRKTE